MAVDPGLAWLRDVEKVRALPQRYARAIDARDIDAVGVLFDPNGRVDGAHGSQQVPAYLDTLRQAERVYESSMHVLGDPLIELEPGSDSGRMDTYAVVYQLRPSGSDDDDLVLGIRYLDEVARSGDDWVITYRKATTMWMRTRPAR